jgi:hypothetical protein
VESIVQRLGRVLRLEQGVFGEIGSDDRATGEAFLVTAAAGAISNLTTEGNIIANFIGGAAILALGLVIWTGIVYLLAKLASGTGTYQELLRGIGYASAPYALGIVPVLGLVGTVYSVVLQVRALKEISGISGGAAAAIVLVPLILVVVLLVIIAAAILSALVGLDLQ